MPFASYSQQRALFKKNPKLAKRWAHTYGTIDASGKRHGPGGKKAEMAAKKKTAFGGKQSPPFGAAKKELARDPGDLVLTGKGTAAQERKRDPQGKIVGGLTNALRNKRAGNRRSAQARAAANARHGKNRARPRRRTSGGRVQRGSTRY